MYIHKILLVGCLGLFFVACSKKDEVKKTEISYEMKNFKVESAGGCKADSLSCAYYEVSYPVFNGLDTAVTRIIAREIDASVAMGNPEAEGETMKQIGEGFIRDFQEFKTEMEDQPMGWHYKGIVDVGVVTDTLLSLSVTEEYYTGGAHGGYGKYFINLRPGTGETFTLDNYLKSGFEQPVTKIAEGMFRKIRDLADTASLTENMFEFPEGQFVLNKNYGFTKDGVVFYYNSYEIASYAAGPTEVLVPYEALKEWRREEGH
ncbi:MAG: DUF3298 domain-containing protein [Chryseolinea sp.]